MDVNAEKIVLSKDQKKEVEIIRKYLISLIRDGGAKPGTCITTYQVMANECKLPYPTLSRSPVQRKALGIALAQLTKEDFNAGKPLIASLIYGVKLYRPRDGFYKTLINLKYTGTLGKTFKQLYQDKTWRRKLESKAVEFWKKDENSLR